MNHSNRQGVSRISVLTTLPTAAGVGISAWAAGSGGEQDSGPSRPASTGDRGNGYLGHQSRAREDGADGGGSRRRLNQRSGWCLSREVLAADRGGGGTVVEGRVSASWAGI
jgi:hypothetical protein